MQIAEGVCQVTIWKRTKQARSSVSSSHDRDLTQFRAACRPVLPSSEADIQNPWIVKKFHAVSATRRFFIVFPSAFLLPLLKTRCVQFLPFCFFTSLFNVTLPTSAGSSRWSLSFPFHYQNPWIISFVLMFSHCILTIAQLVQWLVYGSAGSIPVKEILFFSFPKRSDRLCCPPSLVVFLRR